ncbi:MAG: thiamine ABC transporter substrate binding subunit [Alphaproteobacteria bacterium]|nr:MAG: thiamine ABC transporter substrate binding subunit [Alphaproteobacteria bacterium]
MRLHFRHILAAGLTWLAASAVAAGERPELVVYTYDSFVSDWGPGPAIEKAFEARCGCDLKLVGVGDGAALLGRIRLEGARSPADVVLGLDTNLTHAAAATGLFAEHGRAGLDLDLPIAWEDRIFLPYDWGFFAFVHDKGRVPEPPHSFEALAASDLKIVIEDPRSSTPGLGLLLWVKTAYGERAAEIWKGLADNIVTVTKGWSEAYGMFLDGEADMVLSYTTSPAYHRVAEKDDSKDWARFDEGHYMQVEVMGRLKASDQPELAQKFIDFMLSDEAQAIIPTTNWMYPARMPEGGLPEGFRVKPLPEPALLLSPEQAAAVRDAALAEWLTALGR